MCPYWNKCSVCITVKYCKVMQLKCEDKIKLLHLKTATSEAEVLMFDDYLLKCFQAELLQDWLWKIYCAWLWIGWVWHCTEVMFVACCRTSVRCLSTTSPRCRCSRSPGQTTWSEWAQRSLYYTTQSITFSRWVLHHHSAGRLDQHGSGWLDCHGTDRFDCHAAGRLDRHTADWLDCHGAGQLDPILLNIWWL